MIRPVMNSGLIAFAPVIPSSSSSVKISSSGPCFTAGSVAAAFFFTFAVVVAFFEAAFLEGGGEAVDALAEFAVGIAFVAVDDGGFVGIDECAALDEAQRRQMAKVNFVGGAHGRDLLEFFFDVAAEEATSAANEYLTGRLADIQWKGV